MQRQMTKIGSTLLLLGTMGLVTASCRSKSSYTAVSRVASSTISFGSKQETKEPTKKEQDNEFWKKKGDYATERGEAALRLGHPEVAASWFEDAKFYYSKMW